MTVVHDAQPGGRGAAIPTRIPLPGPRALVAALAIAVTIGALLAIRDTAAWRTTYGGASPMATIADLAAGLGLIVAGLYAGADRPGRRLGSIAMLTGAAWLASDIVGWQGTPMELRMLALGSAVLVIPLVLHIVAIAPGRRPSTAGLRTVLVAAYVVAVGVDLGLITLHDPAADVGCWSVCSANPLLLLVSPAAESALASLVVIGGVLGGSTIMVVAAWRLARASPVARRSKVLILMPGFVVGLAIVVRSVVLAWWDAEGPNDAVSMVLFEASAWALAGLAAGIAAVSRRDRRTRRAVRAMAAAGTIGHEGRTAEEVLAAATGDSGLRVAYWLPGDERFVDARGRSIDPPSSAPGRLTTTLKQGDEVVAVISHDPDLLESTELTEHLGAAARLALGNERLDAESLVQLAELRESRSRIVEAGDRERRRRERDLHDGAQQQLLALTYDLRRARAAAEASAASEATSHLDAAIEAVHAAHDELRELAHGIYPAVLGEAGLARALENLVDRAPIPVRLVSDGLSPCAASAEMTAYVVAGELIRDAAERRATHAAVRVARDADRLVLEVRDDGSRPGVPIIHGQDRAGAAGGRLTVEAGPGHENAVTLEVPCASS